MRRLNFTYDENKTYTTFLKVGYMSYLTCSYQIQSSIYLSQYLTLSLGKNRAPLS